MNRSCREFAQRGVSLVELVVAIVVLGIVAAGMAWAFASQMNRSATGMWHGKAMKLGQLYLDEILSKHYDHNTPLGAYPPVASPACGSLGPESETREEFNDVDDYHNLTDSPPVSILTALDSSYAGYSVHVTVVCDGDGVGASADQQAKRITVTVSPPSHLSGSALVFSAYRGNF